MAVAPPHLPLGPLRWFAREPVESPLWSQPPPSAPLRGSAEFPREGPNQENFSYPGLGQSVQPYRKSA